MITKSLERILAEAVAIEDEAAKEAGELGFMTRAMVYRLPCHTATRRRTNFAGVTAITH